MFLSLPQVQPHVVVTLDSPGMDVWYQVASSHSLDNATDNRVCPPLSDMFVLGKSLLRAAHTLD